MNYSAQLRLVFCFAVIVFWYIATAASGCEQESVYSPPVTHDTVAMDTVPELNEISWASRHSPLDYECPCRPDTRYGHIDSFRPDRRLCMETDLFGPWQGDGGARDRTKFPGDQISGIVLEDTLFRISVAFLSRDSVDLELVERFGFSIKVPLDTGSLTIEYDTIPIMGYLPSLENRTFNTTTLFQTTIGGAIASIYRLVPRGLSGRIVHGHISKVVRRTRDTLDVKAYFWDAELRKDYPDHHSYLPEVINLSDTICMSFPVFYPRPLRGERLD